VLQNFSDDPYSLASGWNANETVLFSPDSSLLAAYETKAGIRLWNTKTGEEVARLGANFENWVHFRFSPDGRFLVLQDTKNWPHKNLITFWNIESKQEQGNLEGRFDTLAFAPDGQSFATFNHKDRREIEVLLWKMDQAPVLVKQHQVTASTTIAFSPDLKTFAAVDNLPDGDVHVAMWDTLTGEKRWSATLNNFGHLDSLSFIANGKVLSGNGWGWRTMLWDVAAKPKEIGFFSTPFALSSPDGEWLALPLDSGAKLIRISAPDGRTDLTVNGDLGPSAFFPAHDGMKSYPTPSFSPDSKMILVPRLYRSGQKPFLGDWLPKQYNPFPAGPDGDVVRVWDTESRREVAAFDQCSEAWFSPDGQVLATLRERKAIDLWKVPFHASFGPILVWTVIVWLIVVSVAWAGVKIRRNTAFMTILNKKLW
jgi:WD40 repeat protein